MIDGYRLGTLSDFVGRELGCTDWLTIDQRRIDAVAACTDDAQWLHVDAARAARESPLGGTIAHGYLQLSLLTRFHREIGVVPAGIAQVLNYGLDRLRFLAPVPVGARLRCKALLLAVEAKAADRDARAG